MLPCWHRPRSKHPLPPPSPLARSCQLCVSPQAVSTAHVHPGCGCTLVPEADPSICMGIADAWIQERMAALQRPKMVHVGLLLPPMKSRTETLQWRLSRSTSHWPACNVVRASANTRDKKYTATTREETTATSSANEGSAPAKLQRPTTPNRVRISQQLRVYTREIT